MTRFKDPKLSIFLDIGICPYIYCTTNTVFVVYFHIGSPAPLWCACPKGRVSPVLDLSYFKLFIYQTQPRRMLSIRYSDFTSCLSLSQNG
jgi:hypothetical protein